MDINKKKTPLVIYNDKMAYSECGASLSVGSLFFFKKSPLRKASVCVFLVLKMIDSNNHEKVRIDLIPKKQAFGKLSHLIKSVANTGISAQITNIELRPQI